MPQSLKSLIAIAVLTVMSGQANAQPIPATLAPPPPATLIGTFPGKGVQVYTCTLMGSVFQWTYAGPQAALTDAKGELFAEYYDATWEAVDTSTIVGTIVASEPAPRPDAIPWYLASVASSSGAGVLIGVGFVQQINTVGGVGPVGGCPTPGEEVRIEYTADYRFFK